MKMQSITEVSEAVREFLAGLCDVSELSDQDSIFADGFVNSLYLVQLLTFIQEQFAVVLDEDDYDMANFGSIEMIAKFVAHKRGEV